MSTDQYSNNQTKDHADARIFQMELGMLARQPSLEYLNEMRTRLMSCLSKIETAIFEFSEREKREREAEEA